MDILPEMNDAVSIKRSYLCFGKSGGHILRKEGIAAKTKSASAQGFTGCPKIERRISKMSSTLQFILLMVTFFLFVFYLIKGYN
jgi:hypothetical protein